MTRDELLKLALETLEGFIPYLPLKDEAQCNRYDKAITAIKEALAQPEQEPVAVNQATMELAESVGLIGPASRTDDLHQAIQRFHDFICFTATVKAAQMAADVIRKFTPPQRKPLSDEQIGEIGRKYEKFDNQGNEFFARWGFARAIEAAHGIKE